MNGDNFRFLDALRKSYGGYSEKVVICGLMSCRGDAYNPADALAVDEALEFHAWQAEKLADTGVDFLLAATLPAFSEATGLALALAATAKPYVLSFVVRPEGTLLDGTPLKDAIAAIDAPASPSFGLSDQLHPCLLCQVSADARSQFITSGSATDHRPAGQYCCAEPRRS